MCSSPQLTQLYRFIHTCHVFNCTPVITKSEVLLITQFCVFKWNPLC
uniref:Macaca fascicularis brain cDNA, clone: QflA-23532 n=1 Tax=Macaca fascicularis TaxID=9541 RepID=I7GP24_MACFA|nr:unnamed protein product [Macaca fascicularis]